MGGGRHVAFTPPRDWGVAGRVVEVAKLVQPDSELSRTVCCCNAASFFYADMRANVLTC